MYDLYICNCNHPSGRPTTLLGSRESATGPDLAKLMFSRSVAGDSLIPASAIPARVGSGSVYLRSLALHVKSTDRTVRKAPS